MDFNVRYNSVLLSNISAQILLQLTNLCILAVT